MDALERTAADLRNARLTTGPHPLAHLRPWLQQRGILPSAALARCPDGRTVTVAGLVITRQRPGTAKGVCFITLEDETGFCNVVVFPQVFARHRPVLVTSAGLIVSGKLERKEDVIHLKGERFEALAESVPAAPSRDFH
jgi:error-prone DNA polymerase